MHLDEAKQFLLRTQNLPYPEQISPRCYGSSTWNPFHLVTTREDAEGSPANVDFVLVPAQLASALAGQKFDILINTASLSEMTQAACDWYLEFFQKQLQFAYFYNLNRFGRYQGGIVHEDLGNTSSSFFGIDQASPLLALGRFRQRRVLDPMARHWRP
jgi:hypothetical protein